MRHTLAFHCSRSAFLGMQIRQLIHHKHPPQQPLLLLRSPSNRHLNLRQYGVGLSAATSLERTSYSKDDPGLAIARAKVEVEMFQADLDYRQALAQLKTLMGEQ